MSQFVSSRTEDGKRKINDHSTSSAQQEDDHIKKRKVSDSDRSNMTTSVQFSQQQIYEYINQRNFEQALDLLMKWMNSDQATADDSGHIFEYLKKIHKFGFNNFSSVFRDLEDDQHQNDCKKLLLACMNCGRCGHAADFDKARLLFQSDSLKSHYLSQNMMGNLYFEGKGVPINYIKAKEYYELAAQQNYSSGVHNMGNMYYYGHGVAQDYMKAKECFELASQKALLEITCHNNYAFENHYSEAMCALGMLFQFGLGVDQSHEKAKECYEAAAKHHSAKAYYNLGVMNYLGHGVPIDMVKAREYYELAAAQNHSDAINEMGNLYFNGDDVVQSYEKAREYYERAVQLNNTEAMLTMAEMFEQGLGVTPNFEQAAKYYKMASDLNDPTAQYHLAVMYADGIGVPHNVTRAIYYFELAAAQSFFDAQEKSNELRLKRFCLNFSSAMLKNAEASISFSDVNIVALDELENE
ncbi:hypothetical protein C9374_008840 [Naegleria lovaniensis]|uniref:Uncharacterized protein n=1 Tax=Naegleria lovaniensis TaxID=51637 RepID=A0AA88KFF4_NAELO|nr:uncharacterized protein C9374_013031 [Naegleria lovaniensis]XP_044545017.1 uncharacterized protein C9374_008840 [Naegleria lovaniensis]KAG2372909.1 hypothetical protein C9374_013031 [Naegleria lovaniensis]KAG2377755.1 hypothetical protein C9374_008840 [Naegleria lovaniensis]